MHQGRPSDTAPQPENPRPLGRPRACTRAELPERLVRWHAPRVNRWERLCVTAGTLAIEMLGAAGTERVQLETGEVRWIAPGVRWRVARMSEESCLDLEIYADSLGPADAPQDLRSNLFQNAERVTVADATALNLRASELAPGETCLIRGSFYAGDSVVQLLGDGAIFWHPLAAGADGFTAFVARANHPFNLPEYLGRDHAVIEAALAGAPRGDHEYMRWLHATLARHLALEEELLFPAYLRAGGREAWVRGLKNEHAHLRRYLAELDQADSRRKFLRLLDGHDEKEERVVYPDILAHVGAAANDLLARAITFPIPE